jgi:biofilm PGA synthesis N-glycosyltransferase PgaC
MPQALELDRATLEKGAGETSRPSVSAPLRFAVAFALTIAWVGFALWASAPWREELREAIGPVMAWVIPTFLAYIPSLVIGFMIFTLVTLRYRVPSPAPPPGPWPEGEWPPVTIVIAARNEEESIGSTLEHLAALSYEGDLEVVLADNDSSDGTAELAERTAERAGLSFHSAFESEPGKWRALNTASRGANAGCGDGRRRHPAAPRRVDLPDRAPGRRPGRRARLRLRGRAGGRERARRPADPHAGLGLPPRASTA